MRHSLLCRERLERIECILNRAAGEPVTVRDFTRRYDVWKWELEQAADLGWIEIIVRKPRTGRPSPAVKFQEHSENPPAKLPPPRWAMEKMISCRHFNFAMQAANALKRGNRTIVYLQCMTDAYLKSFPHARKRHVATSSMSRLLKHPDVKAARAWYFAKVNLKIPFSEPMPQTRQGIRIKLNEAVSRFAQRGRFL